MAAETDPVKRQELLGIRNLVIVVQKAAGLAHAAAIQAQEGDLSARMNELLDGAHEAELAIIERLVNR